MPRELGFRDACRRRFIALLPDIRKAFDEGQSMLGYYRGNKSRLGMSYAQLCRYVREAGLRGTSNIPAVSPPAPSRAPVTQAAPRQMALKPVHVTPAKERTFVWDPVEAYKKKYD